MNKIVLWGYWSKNFGDDLFLIALKNKIMKKNSIPIYICCNKENSNYYRQLGFKVVITDSLVYKVINKFRRFFRRPDLFFKLVNKKCIFVMLGGSLFTEYKNTFLNKRQLINLNYSVKKCYKSYVIGSNFGPFVSNTFLQKYINLFKKVEWVSFRDKYSYDLFKKYLRNVSYNIDICLEGDWDDEEKYVETNKYISLSLIDLSTRDELSVYQKDYENVMSQICNYYIDKGYMIALLSFCKKEGDMNVINRIVSTIKQKNKVEIIDYKDIKSITNIIKMSKKVYATRFHAIMLAMYYKKEVIPFVYNVKTKNALDSYSNNYISFDIKQIHKFRLDEMINLNQVISYKKDKKGQMDKLIKGGLYE